MTQPHLNNQCVIGISSRALFDLDESHEIYEKEGVEAYRQYQIDNEHELLETGTAFSLVKKLLAIRHPTTHARLFEVVLLSRNSADTGLRIFNSIHEYKLDITRAVFTTGESPYPYVNAFHADLFLSMQHEDVINALNAGCAAATLLPRQPSLNYSEQCRIAFDGDAVLFSDAAERVFQQHGVETFKESERAQAKTPLEPGPFKSFLSKLHKIQQCFNIDDCPIRTALITARDAPSHERVIRTLRDWQIRIDESVFLGGLCKQEFLSAFAADIFFDDQHSHCVDASTHVTSGHVPHGIKNIEVA